MNQRPLQRWAIVLLATAFWAAWASTASAREGFYLGGGFASQTVSGGLDGDEGFSDGTGTIAILAGKPESGSGFAFLAGYGFNPVVGIEYLFASTSHTASHSAVDFDSNMSLGTGLLGVRLTYPYSESLEIYGRVGLASAVATYDKYTLRGTTFGTTFIYSSTSEAEFTGSGSGFGAGIEFLLGKVGLSANYSSSSVTFDKGQGGGVSGELPSELSSTITQLAFIATYYFK